MSISRFFERELNAPLKNVRWSWGPWTPKATCIFVSGSTSFGLSTASGMRSFSDALQPPALIALDAWSERTTSNGSIRQGARAFCIVCQAKDPGATPKTIDSFETSLLQGRRVVTRDGNTYLEVTRISDLVTTAGNRSGSGK